MKGGENEVERNWWLKKETRSIVGTLADEASIQHERYRLKKERGRAREIQIVTNPIAKTTRIEN